MITIIIPTLNRPQDLLKVVISILSQTIIPNELVIVDQSPSNDSKNLILKILKKNSNIKIKYIHDITISGLVEAKKVGAKLSNGKLIFFLDDDVILEPKYIENISKSFKENQNMVGCSGVITNPPKKNLFYVYLYKLFHRGIFYDLCINLDESLKASKKNNFFNNKLVPSKMLCGGASAWRSIVFKEVPFDVKNQLHAYEDFDFSLRVYNKYGNNIFINPNARLQHYPSAHQRDFFDKKQKRKLIDCFTFYKKHSLNKLDLFIFLWLIIGMFLEALFESLRYASLGSLGGFISGVYHGTRKKVIK